MSSYQINIEPIESMPDYFRFSFSSGDLSGQMILDRGGLEALPGIVSEAKARAEHLKQRMNT
ncbi:hypothetical protein BPY_01100 [Bifidobacterium psychraerophilum]|uniref:hypothetical protein n=1 Tax=Bifidobacterium psychraerophilum TaxID=218140 RepID=UPI003112CCBC